MFVSASLVAFEQGSQSLRGVPAIKRVCQILRASHVAEPCAAARRDLAKIRTAIGGKDEWERKPIPRAVVRREIDGPGETATVALGLLQRSGYISVLPLRFYRGQRQQSGEQHVVRRAIRSRPLSDREILSLLGPRAFWMRQRRRIQRPTGSAQLFVDQLSRLGFVEVHRRCGPSSCVDRRVPIGL